MDITIVNKLGKCVTVKNFDHLVFDNGTKTITKSLYEELIIDQDLDDLSGIIHFIGTNVVSIHTSELSTVKY